MNKEEQRESAASGKEIPTAQERQSKEERTERSVRKYDAQYKPFYCTYFTGVVLCTEFLINN